MRGLGATERGPKDICQFEAWSQKTCHIILHAFIIFHLLVWFRGSQWVSKILEYGKSLGGRTFGIKCLNRNWQTLENDMSAKWASIISSHWDFMVTFYRSYPIPTNLPLCLLYFSHLWYLSYVFCFPHHLEWCIVKIKYVVHDLKASCDIWSFGASSIVSIRREVVGARKRSDKSSRVEVLESEYPGVTDSTPRT